MQDRLFPEVEAPAAVPAPAPAPPAVAAPRSRLRQVRPAPWPAALADLAARLPARLHLGTSSWSFPGWDGLVWEGEYTESMLARGGLATYAQHPLMRAVSLDRAFYQPLTVAQYAAYAERLPDDDEFEALLGELQQRYGWVS